MSSFKVQIGRAEAGPRRVLVAEMRLDVARDGVGEVVSGLAREHRAELNQFLSQCDLVKVAGLRPVELLEFFS